MLCCAVLAARRFPRERLVAFARTTKATYTAVSCTTSDLQSVKCTLLRYVEEKKLTCRCQSACRTRGCGRRGRRTRAWGRGCRGRPCLRTRLSHIASRGKQERHSEQHTNRAKRDQVLDEAKKTQRLPPSSQLNSDVEYGVLLCRWVTYWRRLQERTIGDRVSSNGEACDGEHLEKTTHHQE